ncbi:hypothetical protein F5Y19DRAFT_132143 [Xylariaceae sp. FL1651]|nr:hypothetical protein F5Y19DRAFT_132143 [Xylariaceae sp. FL1651]
MAQEKMTLEDWLDDLCVRFIINLPRADLSSVARICFQIEEAQWFYEDFIRPLDPTLPSMSLRTFSLKMFQHCPLLASFSADIHLKAFDEFMQYKTRVPVRGAVMLNDAMDAAVLVRGYKKGASWSFPRGKINKDEDDLDCAIREVYEETGYDLREAGLVEKNAPVYPLEVTMHDQQVRLYVFRGVPEDTIFETRTRKEIGDIKWYRVSDLPAYRKKKVTGKSQGPMPSQEKFYMVAPFMVQLRQWVLKQKKLDAQNAPAYTGHNHPPIFYDDNLTDDDTQREPSSAPLGTHPEIIDSATKELHRLLQIKPPTQGLQLPSSTSSQQPGQTLMSILQPKMVNAGSMSGQGDGQSYTPLDQDFANAPQPPAPHHHHPNQGASLSEYSAPPSFHGEHTTNLENSNRQQYQQQPERSRPQVYVTNEVSQPSYFQKPRQSPKPPVQLVHPQPLPPQVQKAMLLRDLASSPNVAAAAAHPAPFNIPQGFQPTASSTHHQAHGPQDDQGHAKHSPHLPTHSANLLNVLKGKNFPTTSAHQSTSHPSPLSGMVQASTDRQHQEQRIPVSQTGYPGQYGNATMPPTVFPTATMNAPPPFSASGARPFPPTDKHRAGLLDMFKTGQSTVSQNQIDDEGASLSPAGSQPSNMATPKYHQWAKQSPSTADVLKAAAQENGNPVQRNPETNLPFGAHSILSRPRPSQTSAHSPALSTRNSNEPAVHIPVRSHPSPASSRGHRSPYQGHHIAKVHPPKQATPQTQYHTASSYPYGGSQGSAPNPLAQFQGAPASSTLPMPGMVKPRQNSTVEHRNNLLSIFGKSQSDPDQGRMMEPMVPEQVGHATAPRSRLASFASHDSRRGSATPLSPADRNFLLGFLENASHNAKS